MTSARASIHSSATTLLLLPAALAALCYAWTLYWLPMSSDGAVFVYVAQTILRGGLPYVDTWDHKGPLIYLFNAAGLLLGGGSVRGPLALEGAMLCAALLASTVLWARLAGRVVAGAVGLAFVVSYVAWFGHGLRTETLVIPLQLLCYTGLALLISGQPAEPQRKRLATLLALGLGVAVSVALLTRANNAVGLVVAAIWLVQARPGDRWRLAALLMLGAAAIALPVLAYLAASGAWPDMVDQYLLASLSYAAESPPALRAKAVAYSLGAIAGSVLWMLVLVGAGTRLAKEHRPGREVFALASIAAADVISQLAAGRSSAAYLLVALPALAVLGVLLLKGTRTARRGWSLGLVAILVLAAGAGSVVEASASLYSVRTNGLARAGSELAQSVLFIRRNTGSGDTILVVGHEVGLLVGSERRSATRMSYVWPLVHHFGPRRGEAAARYVEEALQARPKLILFTQDLLDCKTNPPSYYEPTLAPLVRLCMWMRSHYQRAPDLHGRELWIRRSEAPQAARAWREDPVQKRIVPRPLRLAS